MPGREWVKLRTNVQRELTFALATVPAAEREAAELLHYRAWQWCGAVESAGHVPRAVLPELCRTRGATRAQLLVDAGWWEVTPTGWLIPSWEAEQTDADELARRRSADAERSAAYRARKAAAEAAASRDAPRDRPRGVTGSEQEVEVDTAACGSSTPPQRREFVPVSELPSALIILRRTLEAHRYDVGWDRLTAAQVAQVEALIELHGDAELLRVVKAKWRPDAPAAYVNAWLNAWAALPAPGLRLRVVDDNDRRPPRVADPAPPPADLRDRVKAAREAASGPA